MPIIDLNEFMTGHAIERKEVLDGSDVLKIDNLGANFFVNFPNDRGGARLAKVDSAAKRTIKRLLLYGIVVLNYKNTAAAPERANRNATNAVGGHFDQT